MTRCLLKHETTHKHGDFLLNEYMITHKDCCQNIASSAWQALQYHGGLDNYTLVDKLSSA